MHSLSPNIEQNKELLKNRNRVNARQGKLIFNTARNKDVMK